MRVARLASLKVTVGNSPSHYLVHEGWRGTCSMGIRELRDLTGNIVFTATQV